MSVDPVKFVINKGVNNTFTFTVKQTGSTQPMVIKTTAPADTFTYRFINLYDESSNPITGSLTVTDAANGKVSMTISASDSNSFVSYKGDVCDGRYLKPAYRLLIECNTNANGNFIAKVPKVYVE